MYAIVRDQTAEAVTGSFTDNDGIRHPAIVLTLWTPEELAAIDVYPVIETSVPEGKVATGSTLVWDGETVTRVWVLQNAPAPTAEMVLAERARRLALGFDYDFGDTRGVHRIGTTDADMRGWDEVSTWAGAMLATDRAGATLTIITDTGPCVVTALEWQDILAAATAFRQPIWGASFTLQAMDPIPADYTNDEFWP